MAHGVVREGKWRGNQWKEWVASTIHTTSEHGVSSITTADAHTSAAGSRLNWRLRRFKWTRSFRRKTKSGFCARAITFQLASTYLKIQHQLPSNTEVKNEWRYTPTSPTLSWCVWVPLYLLLRDTRGSPNGAQCIRVTCCLVDASWNVMAHAQKPDFDFRRNGRIHLNRRRASVQSTTGIRGVRISGSNAGHTMFRGTVKGTGYPLHSPVSPSLPLPCVTVCHHISTGVYEQCQDLSLCRPTLQRTKRRSCRCP